MMLGARLRCSNDEVEPSLPTKSTRHILIGKYSPEKPAEKRVIADLFRRNASFEHSSNKQQFLLFESHISPAFLKTNPEYFKRKIGSPVPPSPASYRGNADLHFSLASSTEVSAVH
jgi:hypothetical protein